MYATVEDNKLHFSVAEYYSAQWYDKHVGAPPLSRHDQFEFEYGSLEIDIHRDGRKFLTGFVVDPRKFIVDYLKSRHRKNFSAPKRVVSVGIESSEYVELFSVAFLKARSFVIDDMDKDSITPQFTRRRGKLLVQGFDVLDAFSVIKYLVKRFGYKDTSRIRSGNRVYDLVPIFSICNIRAPRSVDKLGLTRLNFPLFVQSELLKRKTDGFAVKTLAAFRA